MHMAGAWHRPEGTTEGPVHLFDLTYSKYVWYTYRRFETDRAGHTVRACAVKTKAANLDKSIVRTTGNVLVPAKDANSTGVPSGPGGTARGWQVSMALKTGHLVTLP
ncbi:hypothetical protein DL546_001958 [Coniochaeta pulveracea]|uniref:Uncharacterized protein n=1 Tax=Coniochaeta pulveracea TaxID=177199 RepID=A0A420YAI9_9PEZI|nr:hypothetical protein DL546_001958 [Coniochaeta pulveracea]